MVAKFAMIPPLLHFMFEFQELPRPRNAAAGQERCMLQKCEVDKKICGGGPLGNHQFAAIFLF
jgi:hypothetical protein